MDFLRVVTPTCSLGRPGWYAGLRDALATALSLYTAPKVSGKDPRAVAGVPSCSLWELFREGTHLP